MCVEQRLGFSIEVFVNTIEVEQPIEVDVQAEVEVGTRASVAEAEAAVEPEDAFTPDDHQKKSQHQHSVFKQSRRNGFWALPETVHLVV